jgi:hypothetical protein
MTAAEIGQFLLLFLPATAVLAVLANLLRRAVAKSSTKAWFLSWTAYGVGMGSWFASGAVYGLTNYSGPGWLTVTIGCGQAGAMIGMAIGAFIWHYYRKEIEGDEDTR